uniref:Uncharacterized protein n=1 Tax=viral metagenome TaxID=1070528 RepID=A0A6M3LIS3_9ZZZZ
MIDYVKPRSQYTYRCKVCGFECRKSLIPGSSVPVTKTGDYGSNGTPAPETFADEMYEATTISFTDADPDYLSDSLYRFGEKGFAPGMTIRIATTSTTNDGDYTIGDLGVTRGQITLSTADSLDTEDAATAGTVTISRVIYSPNISAGCPFCGSLASR